MAILTKVNGTTFEEEMVGRNLEFLHVTLTGDLTANLPNDADGVTPSTTYLDLVRQVMDGQASVTIVGEATATDVIFVLESSGAAVTGGAAGGAGEPAATIAAMVVAIDLIPTLSASAVVVNELIGAVLVPV